MAVLTISGSNSDQVVVTVDGSQAIARATDFQNTIENAVNGARNSISDTPVDKNGGFTGTSSSVNYGIVTAGGSYFLNSRYNDVAIGGNDKLLSDPVTLIGGGAVNSSLTVLAGNNAPTTFFANHENGTIIGGAGGLNFIGKDGNYNISTSESARDSIWLGNSTNFVYSSGQDTIVGSSSGTHYQTVTVTGTKGTLVNLGDNSTVLDTGKGNQITVGGQSYVSAGTQSYVSLSGAASTVIGGISDTISATGAGLRFIHGENSSVTAANDLTFLNGTGKTYVQAGASTVFGADGLNIQYVAKNDGVFIASSGNETLDGSLSDKGLKIFGANDSNLNALGGNQNDTFVGSSGNMTMSGGAGSNVFLFQNGLSGGNDIITDFNSGKDNLVALYGYGLDQNSLNAILAKADHSGGNTAIELSDNTKITFVNVQNLTTQNFDLK